MIPLALRTPPSFHLPPFDVARSVNEGRRARRPSRGVLAIALVLMLAVIGLSVASRGGRQSSRPGALLVEWISDLETAGLDLPDQEAR
jgi:hypothetical protein